MRKTRRSITLTGLLQASAMLTIVFSLLTAIDSAYYEIELFSPFRLQYLLVSLVLMIVLAALRKPVYAAALLATAAFNAVPVVPWYLGEPAAADGPRLTILNANVLSENDDYERLLELVSAEQPDVIFVQEYTHAWARETQRLQADYPYSYSEPRHDNFGIAMFSRLPVDDMTHVESPPLGYPTIVASLSVDGKPLTLISSHPTVPVSRSSYETRNVQLDSLTDLINATTGAIVFCGDLNATMWDHSYKLLAASTGLRNARRGFGVLPTWPTFMPFAMIPIDHVLISEQVQVAEARTTGSIGSDHLPLLVTLAL